MCMLLRAWGLLGLACLAGTCARAVAQPLAPSDEISVYAGEFFSQGLNPAPVPGVSVRLPNQLTYGAAYEHGFTPVWGLALAVAQTPAQTHHRPGDAPIRLRQADLAVTWNFSPRSWIVGYTLMGAGYVRTRPEPGQDAAGGEPPPLPPRGSATANIGIGARAYLGRHVVLRMQVRYLYLGHILDPIGGPVSALQTTAGLGWRF
jgi:hypothetical protein